MFDLAKAWSMHDKQVATSFYFDPYSMGVRVWRYIDRKYGYDEGEVEIERPVIKWDEYGVPYESDEVETVKAIKRNRDKMKYVANFYEDRRFLTEFLNEELIEEINLEALAWVRNVYDSCVCFPPSERLGTAGCVRADADFHRRAVENLSGLVAGIADGGVLPSEHGHAPVPGTAVL